MTIKVYRIAKGKDRRIWLIGDGPADIWVWDQDNPNGLCGELKRFPVENGAIMAKGPWAASERSLTEETGEKL